MPKKYKVEDQLINIKITLNKTEITEDAIDDLIKNLAEYANDVIGGLLAGIYNKNDTSSYEKFIENLDQASELSDREFLLWFGR